MAKQQARHVILINHRYGKRDDRASRMLAARGYVLDWYCPGAGDDLPQADERHVAAIVYGGIENLSQDEGLPHIRAELDWISRWLKSGRPYLGFCLGGQLLARTLGARVYRHPEGYFESGYYRIRPTEEGRELMSGMDYVYHWHGEGFDLPGGATLLAVGDSFPNQAFRYGDSAFGLQFHPEITPKIFQRWLADVPDVSKRPGAHAPERQIADGRLHDAPMGRWFERFLDTWLGAEDAG